MKSKFLFAWLICLTQILTGQVPEPVKLTTPAPQSPEAAALGKYGEVPVGYYTGVPKVELPVYEIQSGTLRLPVSLSYHAGGVKVEETATWVGLGWSLNAGGAVNRMMRGLADESGNGYLATGYMIDQHSTMTSPQKLAYYQSLNEGLADGQQDIFSFALTEGGGKFFYNKQGRIYTVPQSKNKIVFGNYFGKEGWKITDQTGTEYFFTDAEESFSSTSTDFSGSNPPPQYQVSSWYITKIRSANGKDSISFEYDLLSFKNTSLASVSRDIPVTGVCPMAQIKVNYGMTEYLGLFLKKINFRNGSVVFERETTAREDLPGTYRLKYIKVKDLNNRVVKSFQLFHTYESSFATQYLPSHQQFLQKRMYLDSVGLRDSTAGIASYKYEYQNRHLLPYRLGYSQDHWGYYNGSASQHLIPTSFLNPYITGHYFYGANREPSGLYATAGTLNKITYPTGGTTEFEFEPNTISNFMSVVNPGLDLTDTTKRFQIIGDPLGSTTSYQGSFTIERDYASSGGVIGVITLGLPGADAMPVPPPGPDDPVIALTYPNNSTANLHHNTTLFLPNGNYSVSVSFPANTDPDLIREFYLYIDYTYGVRSNNAKLNNTIFGGLRVRKIKDIENGNQVIRKFEYTDSLGKSSGGTNNFPYYYTNKAIKVIFQDCNQCESYSVSSVSMGGLAVTQGSFVGYQRVRELIGENGEGGFSEYRFTNPLSNSDLSTASIFPYPPETSFEWVRGLPTYDARYKKDGSGYNIIQEKINNYHFLSTDSFTVSIDGFKAGKHTYVYCGPGELGNYYDTARYQNKTSHVKLVSDTTRIYDMLSGNLIDQTISNYQYSPHTLQPSEVTSTLNNTEKSIVRTLSVGDLQFTGTPTQAAALAYKQLKDKNAINLPVEQASLRQTGTGTPRLLQSVLTNYNATVVRPDTVKTIYLSTPSTTFTPASVAANSFTADSRYTIELQYQLYDAIGNLRQAVDKSNVVTSYLYGYGSAYPVAKVTGASYAQISPFVNQATLDAGGTDTNVLNALVGLYTPGNLPATAMVTNYTYRPLLGITSQKQPNTKKLYYEYDPYGRLRLAKDDNGNIVKKYCYNYAGKQVQCYDAAYTNSQAWSGQFTKNDCSAGNTGSQVSFTVPAGSITSYVSTADANVLAQQHLQSAGQAYANANGTCMPATIYARMECDNYNYSMYSTYGEMVIRFYSDAQCTQPVSVTNLGVNYDMLTTHYGYSSYAFCEEGYNASITANGYNFYIGWVYLVDNVDYDLECHYNYQVVNGTGYTPL